MFRTLRLTFVRCSPGLYIEALLVDPEAADVIWEALDRDQISEYVAAAAWWMIALSFRSTPESGH